MPIEGSFIDSGLVIDEAMLSAMTGVRYQAVDSFDDAAFSVPLEQMIATRTSQNQPEKPLSIHQVISANYHSYIAQNTDFPVEAVISWQLADIAKDSMRSWSGVAHHSADQQWQAHFGYDDNRQALLLHHSQELAMNNSEIGFTLGLDRSMNRWFDMVGYGAFQWGNAHSQWLSLGSKTELLYQPIRFEFMQGKSQLSERPFCLICGGSAEFQSWHLSTNLALPDSASQLAFSVSQPLYLTKMDIALAGASQQRLYVRPKRPARQIETKWIRQRQQVKHMFLLK